MGWAWLLRRCFERSVVGGDREYGALAAKKEGHGVENGGDGGKRRGSRFRSLMKGSPSRLMGY